MLRVLALLIIFLLVACSKPKKVDLVQSINRPDQSVVTKKSHIRNIIKAAGFISLPMAFDASRENALVSKYIVNPDTNDSLVFEVGIYSVVGFLPDTTNYYAFLYPSVGDMLYPTLLTLDKQGNKIDEKIINATGCSGHAALQVKSCYDSVWISSDLTIMSRSLVAGVVQSGDSVLEVCNKRLMNGRVSKAGRIELQQSWQD